MKMRSDSSKVRRNTINTIYIHTLIHINIDANTSTNIMSKHNMRVNMMNIMMNPLLKKKSPLHQETYSKKMKHKKDKYK